ncbi:MAG: hypothetical protein KDL09_15930 [Prosthecobacter sp.]|nr:hypothetical protein [Prosthecobacter sp.]
MATRSPVPSTHHLSPGMMTSETDAWPVFKLDVVCHLSLPPEDQDTAGKFSNWYGDRQYLALANCTLKARPLLSVTP